MPKIFKTIRDILVGEKTEIVKVLERVPIFAGLSLIELKKIEIITHEREYMDNEIIFNEKEPGAGMYIIKSGSIKLSKKVDNKQVFLMSMTDGDFFGEIALLDESPRSATATSAGKTKILGFYRPDFLDLLKREPKLGSKVLLKLAQMIAARLRETTESRVKGTADGNETEP